MKLTLAIRAYLDDMRAEGRITSDRTEHAYDRVLRMHAQDVGNRDPRTVGRADCAKTLARWPNPNTRRINRSILISFYRWTVEEGMRPANPAEQTRRSKPRKVDRYRLTATETAAVLAAWETRRQRWALHLLGLAGLRSAEARGLKGKHLAREGWIHVAPEIAKGGRERWVPVLPQLEDIVGEARLEVDDDHYVLCAIRWRDPGQNTQTRDLRQKPMSAKGPWQLVRDAGARAGVPAPIGPHTLRHAFADHIARHAGERTAQQLLGHASIATTEIYLGRSTLDELLAATTAIPGYPLAEHPPQPMKATTGIEPVAPADQQHDPTANEHQEDPDAPE